MKLFSVLTLSAALIVPCIANATVSSVSPTMPFPRMLGKEIAASPTMPFPRMLGKKIS